MAPPTPPPPLGQVVDKDADAVLDEIEASIFQVAITILEGEGFAFDVPSRAKGNQAYVADLDRIVLKDAVSKRPFASTQTCRYGLSVCGGGGGHQDGPWRLWL